MRPQLSTAERGILILLLASVAAGAAWRWWRVRGINDGTTVPPTAITPASGIFEAK